MKGRTGRRLKDVYKGKGDLGGRLRKRNGVRRSTITLLWPKEKRKTRKAGGQGGRRLGLILLGI